MFLKTAALVLLSNLAIRADNTPNLCSDDITNLQRIAPSETGVTNISNITVGGESYSGDADHFVMIPNDNMVDKVMVYIPGTTDRPELSSCLLKSVSETLDYPTIGISYAYLSSGDKFRNGKCASLPNIDEQVECLDEQHLDAIDGGDYGATHFKDDGSAFWVEIPPENALTARLGKLLEYLDEKNPGMGWNNLYSSKGEPKWSRIAFMGHSQGAGHVAYLGKTRKILGGVMISGPQDECIDCPADTKTWIDEPFMTRNAYTAFASGDEPLYNLQTENWGRMTTAGAVNWGEPTSIDFGLDPVNACDPLFTNVKFGNTSTCGGKEHCSTAIDDSIPFLEKTDGEKFYLYEKHVWPSITTQYSSEACGKKESAKKGAKKASKSPKSVRGKRSLHPKGF